jgi:protein gp37
MADETKIQWCDATFNPWRGCTKVSPGCANCYAETLSARNPAVLGEWGPTGRRVIAAESYWRQPLAWDRKAGREGRRLRVFCASLADVFEDRPELVEPRERLFALIRQTPHLDWLLLTKRPENWRRCWPLDPIPGHVRQNEGDGKDWRRIPNVWLGVSVEDQARADERIPVLLSIPAAVRWVSYEPALGPIDFRRVPGLNRIGQGPGLDWVVVGGESGPKARPFDLAWARSTVEQCRAAGVAAFVKQLGARPVDGGRLMARSPSRDSKGGDMNEWPDDLRAREWPKATA